MLKAVTALVLCTLYGTALHAQYKESDPNRKPSVFLGGPKERRDKPATAREVKGVVLDPAGNPVSGALVSLTDTKTKRQLTYITKADGRYRFDELSFNIDYELLAKNKDETSPVKRLSQYDRTVSAVRNLQLASGTGGSASK